MEKKTLLEQYEKRLSISESVAKKAGIELDNTRKNAIAMVLDNTNKFLNEAFSNSVGTQRADMGDFKKFCLNLTTVALPTLIAPELVIVNPMSSYSGYITYVEYSAGTNKGQTKQGDVFNDPFRLGKVDTEYTSSAVTESFTAKSTPEAVELAWGPVVRDAFEDADGVKHDIKIIDDDAETPTWAFADLDENGKVPANKQTASHKHRVAYKYNNETIPQNDIPTVNVAIRNKSLIAKARRVAVYYSQIAAFQAKQDYGFDLGDQLAEKACGQLAYEIDTEVVNLLVDNAEKSNLLNWNRQVPDYIGKAEHYEGFAEVVDIASGIIYGKTKRYGATYMLCARDVVNVLGFIKGFKAANAGKINGPYMAGTLNGIKVFVSPTLARGEFVLGCNGDDFMSSAAVYAPYMAIVPTQLLGYADGGMSQGFSTMYALEMLNKDLLVKGQILN